jgi:hypothetical protein
LSEGDLWDDTRVEPDKPLSATRAITNQLAVSLGAPYLGSGTWRDSGGALSDKASAIQQFKLFMTGRLTNLTWQVPFTPSRTLYKKFTWEANDPLVHSFAADLVEPDSTLQLLMQPIPFTFDYRRDASLAALGPRYRPWGGNPLKDPSNDPTAYALTLKDPISHPDDWRFPTNLDLGSIGKVHRGSPWQTLYLKADPVSQLPSGSWTVWSGSAETYPTNDWKLVSILAAVFPNKPAAQLSSVNDFDEDSLLQGLAVLTNATVDAAVGPLHPPRLDQSAIQENSDQSFLIALGINRTRREAGGYFREMGSLFATPELSVASPYLNLSARQVRYGIPDEAYEILPAQLLSMLRPDPSLEIEIGDQTVWLRIFGLFGQSYGIETSTDLLDWTSVGEYSVPPWFGDARHLPLDNGPVFLRVRAAP